MTSSRMRKKLAFSLNEPGVGGRELEEPIANSLDGGSESSKVRIWDDEDASLKTF